MRRGQRPTALADGPQAYADGSMHAAVHVRTAMDCCRMRSATKDTARAHHCPRALTARYTHRPCCAALCCAVSCGSATEAQCHGLLSVEAQCHGGATAGLPPASRRARTGVCACRARAARSPEAPDPTYACPSSPLTRRARPHLDARCGAWLHLIYLCCKLRVCGALRCINVTCAQPSD